jgi:hypothetical protein
VSRHFFFAMPSDPETEALQQWLVALVKDIDVAEAKAPAAHRHVQFARLLLEEEQAAAANLKRKATATKRLLPSSSSSSTTFDMVDGATYDSTLITNLHVQVMTVPNICQLVNIVLDTMSSNYAIWCDLMLMAMTRYSLTNHVLSDDAFTDDPAWTRMDVVVLCSITNTITADL